MASIYFLNNDYTKEEVDISNIYNLDDEFDLRLVLSHPKSKEIYNNITNKLLRLKYLNKTNDNKFDNYYFKRKLLVKVRPYYNGILVMFNLKPKKVTLDACIIDKTMVGFKELKKTYSGALVYTLINKENLDDFNALLDLVLISYKLYKPKYLKFVSKDPDVDIISKYNKTSTEILDLFGFNAYQERATSMNCEMSDLLALYATILLPRRRKALKVHTVTVGELSAGFRGNYDINLDLLKACDMALSSDDGLYVKALGEARFSMNVWADEYDLKSIKMILLTKGNVYKYIID